MLKDRQAEGGSYITEDVALSSRQSRANITTPLLHEFITNTTHATRQRYFLSSKRRSDYRNNPSDESASTHKVRFFNYQHL